MQLGVLIVDDEEGIRRSLTRILREDGYLVDTAKNGEEALHLVQENPYNFDIIICDLVMPGIDGIETVRKINQHSVESTKIILTAYGTLEYSIKAIDAGIDGFITKPFQNKELKWKIKDCFLGKKMKQFISPTIYEELLKNPAHLEPKVEKITILFSDIRQFTKISSKYSPDVLATLLNKYYFYPMSDIIMHHEGMIDKYIGDSIMALFGSPVCRTGHEENAVQCAIEMIHANETSAKGFYMGIGISTGYVVTGIFGSSMKKEYTALGLPVNIAARLQKLAGPGEIVISEETMLGTGNREHFHRAGSLTFDPLTNPLSYYKWAGNGTV